MQKSINLFSKITSIPVVILFLLACSVTPQQKPNAGKTAVPISTQTILPVTLLPSETTTKTVSPTQTSTPVPTLIAHKWIPIEPLIGFGNLGGDGGCGFEEVLPMGFTLLSNGELFVTGWNNDSGNFEINDTTLSRQSTCNLLNSIDQTGFFYYDPSTYVNDLENWNSPIDGAGTTYISVQAWKSNSVNLYALDVFINHVDEIKMGWEPLCGTCPDLEFPNILPSIRNTFQLLASYEPANLEIYQSERIGLWVDTYAETSNAIDWSIQTIKLSELVSLEGNLDNNSPNIILIGENAKAVYQLFNQSINVCGINVTEGDKVYQVFARPLLPNEYLSQSPVPSTALSCTPSDGWVEIP